MPAKPGPSAQREQEARRQPRARITLLRHGEPDWAPGGGTTVNDPGLTGFGHEQAQVAAKALAAEAIDAIYVSPLRRAQQTAEPLTASSGVTAVTIDDLAEIGINFEGQSQEQVDRIFVEASRRPLDQHWEGWPGGETFTDFHARVTRGIADVLDRHGIASERKSDFTVWHLPDGAAPHIVIVAHGGTNAVLLTHLLDVRPVPWEWMRYESALCAYSVSQARALGEAGHVWSLQNFNELDHLRAAGLI